VKCKHLKLLKHPIISNEVTTDKSCLIQKYKHYSSFDNLNIEKQMTGSKNSNEKLVGGSHNRGCLVLNYLFMESKTLLLVCLRCKVRQLERNIWSQRGRDRGEDDESKNFHSLQLNILQLSFNNGQLEVLSRLW
ncbi:hypothetical protein PHYBLDRAFT_59129, partial [Phycomyces blakesleeanus NRRL 1555(-)]